MENPVEVFLHRFHSLEGITIADRTKNFFILLHQNASFLKENPQVLDGIVSNLVPLSHLESLFRVDFLVYFRRTEDLLQVLKEGKNVPVSRITKHSWFFKETFNDVNAITLVNKILPSMSFSIRMKVLRKLSRYLSDEKFDEIFIFVVERYGIFIGSQFITGCGPEKVRATLKDYPIQLTSTQLRILHGKDRELISFYFENNSNLIQSSIYKRFFKFIYINDRHLFNYLKQKYKVFVNLGRRTTKKFVLTEKDEIIQNPFNYKFLDMKAVLRKIGKDSLQIFINTLPETPEKCINKNWVVQNFPKRYHYSLYVKTFQSHYKIKFEDFPSLIDSELLGLISDCSERSKLAKVKVDEGDDDFIKFLRIEESILLIKEKINLTSIAYERVKLMDMLVKTCHLNDDFDALFSVMKYFAFRHRNEDLPIVIQFIDNIEDTFGFEKFTDEIWNCFNELLLLRRLKLDQLEKVQTFPSGNFIMGSTVREKLSYLQFLFKKRESIDELIKEYFTASSELPNFPKYDKSFVKYFLIFTINNVAKQTCKSEDIKFCCDLMKEIDFWNRCFKEDPLSLYDFPTLHYVFNYIIRNRDTPYSTYSYYSHLPLEIETFRSKIFTTEENVYRDEYLLIFWDRFEHLGDYRDFRWFIKYDPLSLVKNFERVFRELTVESHSLISCLRMWYIIKKFTHLQLDQMAVEACLTKLNDISVEIKPKFISCLSILMKPSAYAALADSYKPANKKLDLKNENEVRIYNLQSEIASHFKNTKSYEVLSSLLNYCVGDYFKKALRSLYSLLYRTPEDELPQYLHHLSKQAVSVRKHALFLACELCTKSKIEDMIRVLNKQEGVQSLQKHMFATTIKYFVKNPSDQFFELVKLNMVFISKSDEESLNIIVENLRGIPPKYKNEYIMFSWEFLEKTVDIREKQKSLKNDLLIEIIGDIVKNIPVEFGIKIIQQHFMTGDATRDLYQINNLIFNLLISKEERSMIFEKVFEIIDKCTNESEIDSFFHIVYQKIITSSKAVHLAPFVVYFGKRITLIENFLSSIRIFFMRTKLEMPEFDNFVTKIITFFEEVIAMCGISVIPLFASEMCSNLIYFSTKQITVYEYDICYSMMKQRPVPKVALLVLNLVSQPANNDLKMTDIFIKLLRLIWDVNDAGVKVNLLYKFHHFVKTHKICFVTSADEMDECL